MHCFIKPHTHHKFSIFYNTNIHDVVKVAMRVENRLAAIQDEMRADRHLGGRYDELANLSSDLRHVSEIQLTNHSGFCKQLLGYIDQGYVVLSPSNSCFRQSCKSLNCDNIIV
jgi:hypothetical protein